MFNGYWTFFAVVFIKFLFKSFGHFPVHLSFIIDWEEIFIWPGHYTFVSSVCCKYLLPLCGLLFYSLGFNMLAFNVPELIFAYGVK